MQERLGRALTARPERHLKLPYAKALGLAISPSHGFLSAELNSVQHRPHVFLRHQSLENALVGKDYISQTQALEHPQHNQEADVAVQRVIGTAA